ncbi:hypothetical protein MKL29_08645 [Streptococcus suis]|nr:hypothetical protein [Streptococcus suis]
MADLQKLPVQATEVVGNQVWVTPTFEERVPSGRAMFEPYRVFNVSGEKQQDVKVRVNGLNNSEVPTKLSKVTFTGLEMSVGSVQSRGKTKREIVFTAKSMKLVK